MPVSLAPVSSRALNAAVGQERAPGLLEVLRRSPTRARGGAGGSRPLHRRIPVPSEKRIRTEHPLPRLAAPQPHLIFR